MKSNVFGLKDVWKTYCNKGVETHALRGVNLAIKKGTYSAIIGPSGSGKSTLMHIIGCLDTPTKGEVVIDGKNVSKLNDNELAKIRREKIGFVFQAYNLINGLTAIENVALPMRFAGRSRGESQKRAIELLKKVGLENRVHHKPNEMSGGEQQRVAIARSLLNDPEVVLADEPTGNLDQKTGKEIMELIEDLQKKTGKTVIIVTHDTRIAVRAENEIRMIDGKITK